MDDTDDTELKCICDTDSWCFYRPPKDLYYDQEQEDKDKEKEEEKVKHKARQSECLTKRERERERMIMITGIHFVNERIQEYIIIFK